MSPLRCLICLKQYVLGWGVGSQATNLYCSKPCIEEARRREEAARKRKAAEANGAPLMAEATLAPALAHQLRYVLVPALRHYQDKGWPGLSERDRDAATNALADLRSELEPVL